MPLKGDRTQMLKYRSTYYKEADESPSGNYSRSRGQITRSIYTDWDVDHLGNLGPNPAVANSTLGNLPWRDQAALDFAGTAQVLTGPATPLAPNGVKYLSRTLPHPHPVKTFMRVQDVVQVKPCCIRGTTGTPQDGTGMAKYEFAELMLQYHFPDYHFKEDADVLNLNDQDPFYLLPDEGWALSQGIASSRYVKPQHKFASRELLLGRGMMQDTLGRLITESPAVREFCGEAWYTWYCVPEAAVPRQAWLEGSDCVNDDTFDIWPAGTLLFHGTPETHPEPNIVDGQIYYTIQYRFYVLLLPDPTGGPGAVHGHNYIRRLGEYRNSIGTLVKALLPFLVTTDGKGNEAGTRLHPDFDFRKFFRPDLPS